jgi:insertion element IS1 protein InsB
MEKVEKGSRESMSRSGVLWKNVIRDYSELGRLPEVKAQLIEMSLNGRGIRNIARVLKISPTTVIEEIKKESAISSVNEALLGQLDPATLTVELREHSEAIEEAECDEMRSFVGI